jgi:hypothetical protein
MAKSYKYGTVVNMEEDIEMIANQEDRKRPNPFSDKIDTEEL